METNRHRKPFPPPTIKRQTCAYNRDNLHLAENILRNLLSHDDFTIRWAERVMKNMEERCQAGPRLILTPTTND